MGFGDDMAGRVCARRARRWALWGLAWAALLGGFLASVAAEAPRELFYKHCGGCHGKDGRAKTPIARQLGVKDLTLSRLAEPDIERQIREGKAAKDGKTLMPAFKGLLTDEEVKTLIGVVKGLRRN
jgi:mono/diheme cytochrome c family protein